MRSKLLSAVLSGIILFGVAAPMHASANILLGDINCDGKVDSSDASAVLREYALSQTGQQSSLYAVQKEAADIDRSGSLDAVDASLILAYYGYVQTGGKSSFEDVMREKGRPWKDAYTALINSLPAEGSKFFALNYLDNDSIPELWIQDLGNTGGGGLYTYRNGSWVMLKSGTANTSYLGCVKRKGIAYFNDFGQGKEENILYRLSGGELQEIDALRADVDRASPIYTFNGTAVTVEEYKSLKANMEAEYAVSENNVGSYYMRDEIVKVINDWF